MIGDVDVIRREVKSRMMEDREREKDLDVGLGHAKQTWAHERTNHYIHRILLECESRNVIEMSFVADDKNGQCH